ncbi:hypothetical protein PIB30_091891 [Stylosanthes scabra]|uniref:Putative plant transposon protein domain-containing protein n=1 Tax=Stylosanthes scabra TaxID=79078 RepID=A0ABU6RV36_9FABA|nr:hypothetical protein [Stylosanthes scabra]
MGHVWAMLERWSKRDLDVALDELGLFGLNSDERLDEVLQDLYIPGATWRLSSGQPAQPIQLRRAELTPLARGWHEFIIHSIIPIGNKSKITIARAILIHAIIRGEDVRIEELIADNIAVIAQGM